MAIKHHSSFWLHGAVCSQFFHGINCLALCVAATGRSLGTLARVETSSRGWRGSWCRARWRVSVCRICSGHKGSIHRTFGWCLRDQAQSPRGLSDKTCDTGALGGLQITLSCPVPRAPEGPAQEQPLPTVQSPLKPSGCKQEPLHPGHILAVVGFNPTRKTGIRSKTKILGKILLGRSHSETPTVCS